jgi:hypothetical protein
LRHSRRPDGICPRCKQPVDGAAASDGVPPIPESAAAVDAPPPAPFESAGPAAGLGNLAQSARTKELKSARAIMFVVGILTVLVQGFLLSNVSSEVRDAMQQAEQAFESQLAIEIQKVQNTPGMIVDQARVAQAREQALAGLREEVSRAARAAKLIYGGGLLCGLIFIFCGLFVYQHPVAATATAFALYLASLAIFGFLDPTQLAKGFLIKFFIIAGLFKAVQAALAYQKEQAAAPARAA